MSLDSGVTNTYVRDLINPKLQSSFSTAKPLMAWLAGSSVAGLDQLGDPNVGVMFGGVNLGIGQRSIIAGSIVHKFRYHKAQTDAASTILEGATTPTASGFAEDNVGTAGMVWHRFAAPIKVREDSIENVQNGGGTDEMKRLKIADVTEEAVGQGMQRELENLQSELWTGTLTQAQQDTSLQAWAGLLGVQHACSDGSSTGETGFNYYGGVDRTVDTDPLQSNVIDGDDLSSSEITLRLLRQARLGTTASYGEIRKKRHEAGKLIITTPTLWEKLANDADQDNQINSNDIPQFARSGFASPVIRLDDAMVVWDHDCPSGEAYLITPEDWVFEIQKGSNFRMEPWQKKFLNEEGGNWYRWTLIVAKMRLTCRRPDLNIKMRDMTIS